MAEAPKNLDSSVAPIAESSPAPVVPVEMSEKKPEQKDPLPANEELVPDPFDSSESAPAAGMGEVFDSSGGEGGGPRITPGMSFGANANGLRQNSSASDHPAKVLSRAELDYPSEAKARGITGHVLLRLRIGTNGQVEEARVAESDPVGVFESAALRSVRSWRFEPALAQGRPQESWISQRIRFELN